MTDRTRWLKVSNGENDSFINIDHIVNLYTFGDEWYAMDSKGIRYRLETVYDDAGHPFPKFYWDSSLFE